MTSCVRKSSTLFAAFFPCLITALFSMSCGDAHGKDKRWADVDAPFDVKDNLVSESIILWQAADNVQKACEAESRKRGLGGFAYAVEACSFWNGSVCLIITSKKPTMRILGHETRHCFQGNFH